MQRGFNSKQKEVENKEELNEYLLNLALDNQHIATSDFKKSTKVGPVSFPVKVIPIYNNWGDPREEDTLVGVKYEYPAPRFMILMRHPYPEASEYHFIRLSGVLEISFVQDKKRATLFDSEADAQNFIRFVGPNFGLNSSCKVIEYM